MHPRLAVAVVICYMAAITILVHGRSDPKRRIARCANNNRPVIGILTQTVTSRSVKKHFPWTVGRSYFAASYVKFVESAGARVAPIRHDLNTGELMEILNSINGVLFPGGGVSLSKSRYAKTGEKIFAYAKKRSDAGDYFPIFGVCLGFELLAKFAAGFNPLQRTYASRVERKLKFTDEAKSSRMFGGMEARLAGLVTTQALSYHNHKWGVYMKEYQTVSGINSFFKNLATTKDKRGVEFVSAFEARHYPIFGVQWHPEKPPFEWYSKLNMDHSLPSIQFSQFMGEFFVNQTRQSCHDFDASRMPRNALIYAYTPLYSRLVGSSFEQIYVF
eukprot:gene18651-20531_t